MSSELINYSTGTTVPASWLNRTQLREEGLAAYAVYSAGGTFFSKALMPSGIDYSGTSLAGATNPVQQAINALNSLGGGRIHFKGPATYDFTTGQPAPVGFPIPSGFPGGVGLVLYPNIKIEGDGRGTILTTTTAVASNNDYFSMFVNKDFSTDDGFIEIRDLAVILPSPTQTATGMQAWDDTVIFYGAHDSIIDHVYTENGSFQFYPNSVYLNTANALSLGNNFNNKIVHCTSKNQTGNTAFFQQTDSWFVFNRIFHTWDDGFIIASAGTGNKVIGNIVDGGVVVTNKGAATACIYLQNDGAVGSGPTSGVLQDNIIAFNTCKNHVKNNGSQAGIYELAGRNNIYDRNICSGNAGPGLKLEQCDHMRVNGGQYYNNGKPGINVLQNLSGTLYDLQIDGAYVYNNGTVPSPQSGIDISVTAGNFLQDIVVSNCIVYEDQGGAIQPNGIRLGLDGTLSNLLLTGNNLKRQSTPIAIQGTGTVTGRAINNSGYNPFGLRSNAYDNTNNIIGVLGTSSTLTSAKTYTCQFVPLDLYLGGGTVTAMTKNGSTIGSGTSILPATTATTALVHLEPGDTWSITFSVTPATQLVFGL